MAKSDTLKTNANIAKAGSCILGGFLVGYFGIFLIGFIGVPPSFMCPSIQIISFILHQLILLMIAIIIICIGYIKLGRQSAEYLTIFIASFMIVVFILSVLGSLCPVYL